MAIKSGKTGEIGALAQGECDLIAQRESEEREQVERGEGKLERE